MQHLCPLAFSKFLEEDLLTVREANAVSILIRCGLTLGKGDFFDCIHSEIVPQACWNVLQHQVGTWRDANRRHRRSGRPQILFQSWPKPLGLSLWRIGSAHIPWRSETN